MPNYYRPEGMLMDMPENRSAQCTLADLRAAMECGSILEARAVVCDRCV